MKFFVFNIKTEGWWRKQANVELIATAQQLLAQVRERSAVTFVHVRGHTGEEGNERADRLVQWGKFQLYPHFTSILRYYLERF